MQKDIKVTKKSYIYNFLKYIFDINSNEILTINKNNMTYFSHKFRELLYYKWEHLPNKNKTNYIRHVLYHYYPFECLEIYEKSLNLNVGYYIIKNKEKISYESINNLMSKH